MRAVKGKKLTDAGWEIGDAMDFLGLSSEEEAYLELRLKLVDLLIRALIALGADSRDIARIIGAKTPQRGSRVGT